MKFFRLFMLLGLTLISFGLSAQESYPYPSLSPKGKVTQMVGNTQIEVEYERPSVRNREIFGALVPWNKVWRTGAGYCSKIAFDRSVQVGGQTVPAGKYSFFTIPNPKSWMVILNADTTLYGSYDYDHTKDIARFIVQPVTSGRFYETLTIDIDLIPNNAKMYLSWANTQIHFDIRTTTDEDIQRFIQEELMTGKKQDPDLYAGAADYFSFRGTHLKEAILLADKAIALDKNHTWARRMKVEIYEKLQLYEEALTEIEYTIESTKKRAYDQEKYRLEDIEVLKKRAERIRELQRSAKQ